MANSRVVMEWVAKADEDFLFAQKHLQDEESFFAPLCFHGQQAEKYLKAYIVANRLAFRKTHDLIELFEICSEHDGTFSEVEDEAKRLTRYYVDTRYPAVWPTGYTREDAVDALAVAGRIREFIKTKLSLK